MQTLKISETRFFFVLFFFFFSREKTCTERTTYPEETISRSFYTDCIAKATMYNVTNTFARLRHSQKKVVR